jgi:hypothetical protein
MAFSLAVEALNIRSRAKRAAKDRLGKQLTSLAWRRGQATFSFTNLSKFS